MKKGGIDIAGIGFELRKLFYEDTPFSEYIKAVIFSTFISVGSFIAIILVINILMLVSKLAFDNSSEQLLFIITLVYGFIFSQLISFLFQFFMTKYISDRVYEKSIRLLFVGVSKMITINIIAIKLLKEIGIKEVIGTVDDR